MPPTTRPAPPEDPPADDGTVKPTEAEMAEHERAKAKADENKAKADENKAPGLFVIVFTLPGGGGQVAEVHSEETAASRVSALTYGSKQHRKEADEADEALPDGGGTHELNRRDIHVYRLSATAVTDF